MKTNREFIISFRLAALFAFIATVFFACNMFEALPEIPETHPIPLDKMRPICTDCHSPRNEIFPFIKFNHNMNFLHNHREPALSAEYTCKMCHRDSFCSECHGGRLELKPSARKPYEILRRMPHRGNYITRHQIDGRVNPASCFPCHGNPENAVTCIPCHGK